MFLKEFCFPDYWKVSTVVLVLKNVGERSMTKSTPCWFFYGVGEIFEKLANNRLLFSFLIFVVVSGLLVQLQLS